MTEPNYGFSPKFNDPNYAQVDFSELEARCFAEREDVVYDYDKCWDYIRRLVNPKRREKGLEEMTRQDSDMICRGTTNFELDWSAAKAEKERQGKTCVADVQGFKDLTLHSDKMTKLLEREGVIQVMELTAPHLPACFDPAVLSAPKADKQGDVVPKWKRNLPPRVQQNLKRKGRRR